MYGILLKVVFLLFIFLTVVMIGTITLCRCAAYAAALKREIFTGSLSCGPSAVLCGKQHSNYIDFYGHGQVKILKKALF